jgi:hypothetical protein
MSRYSDIPGDRVPQIVRVGTVATDGAAAGLLFVVPTGNDSEIAVKALVSASTTASVTDYATITVYNGGATGTAATSLGAITTQTTVFTANLLRDVVTLTGASSVDAGSVLRFTVAQTTGGKALLDLALVVYANPL